MVEQKSQYQLLLIREYTRGKRTSHSQNHVGAFRQLCALSTNITMPNKE